MSNQQSQNTRYQSDIEATVRGWLTRDPEQGTSKNGNSYVRVSVALGVQQSGDAEFVSVFASTDKGRDRLLKLRKGDRMIAAGELQRSEYTDKQGQLRRAWRVIADWIG